MIFITGDTHGNFTRFSTDIFPEQKQMTKDDYETSRKNLDACGWKVDYIVSHCCPDSAADIIGGGLYQHDRPIYFFEGIKERCEFDYWFFGHYHDNRALMRKYALLYEQIVEVEP